MYTVRYRTHGPWQSEVVETWEEADHLSSKLSRTYLEVVVDLHIETCRYKNGLLQHVELRGTKI